MFETSKNKDHFNANIFVEEKNVNTKIIKIIKMAIYFYLYLSIDKVKILKINHNYPIINKIIIYKINNLDKI